MAEKKLSTRAMIEALYKKFCNSKSPMDTGKQVVVAGEKYVIPDNWQSVPPPGFEYDDQAPPAGTIWIYHPQTGERKAIPACEGGLV